MVYSPGLDSFLLLECIKTIKAKNALDMGCGTGIITIQLAKNCELVTGVDIDDKALEMSKKNSQEEQLNNIKFVKSDLFQNIEGIFDIITFNPPYLPTKDEDITWDGGEGGIEVVSKFLKKVKDFINKNSLIFIIVSTQMDLESLYNLIEKFGFSYSVVGEKRIFFERLYCLKLMLK